MIRVCLKNAFCKIALPQNPVILFFHAMGVTGESSFRVAEYLKEKYFCVMPTSTVYCPGQNYISKQEEIHQVEDYLRKKGIEKIALVVASSIGADLGLAFLAQTKIPVEHTFFDGGQFAQISKPVRKIMVPFLYLAIKSLYWTKGATLGKITTICRCRYSIRKDLQQCWIRLSVRERLCREENNHEKAVF